jgi:hypothetical protein
MASPQFLFSPFRFSWERDYRAAALETDVARLPERIRSAEETLMARFLELTNREEDEVEIEAVEHALKAMHMLRRERLAG